MYNYTCNIYPNHVSLIGSYVSINECDFIPMKHNWMKCPKCNQLPKLWIFDNGRYAACNCGVGTYKHFSISAKPIGEHLRETNGSLRGFDDLNIQKEWNKYCLQYGFLHKIALKLFPNLPKYYIINPWYWHNKPRLELCT